MNALTPFTTSLFYQEDLPELSSAISTIMALPTGATWEVIQPNGDTAVEVITSTASDDFDWSTPVVLSTLFLPSPSSQDIITSSGAPASTRSRPGNNSQTTDANSSSHTSLPGSSLSKATQISLGVGFILGALSFMLLGGFLTYYFLRKRLRRNSRIRDRPHSIESDGNPYGLGVNPNNKLAENALIRPNLPRGELDGVQREVSRKELDGEHRKQAFSRDWPIEKDSITVEIG